MDDIRDRVRSVIDSTATTQREFAASVGMEPTKLSKSLSGTRSFRPAELVAIADVGKVSLDWLLHGVGKRPRPPNRRPLQAQVPARADTRDERRRAEILDAAWRLVARRGLHQTRVADIAEACGMSAPAIHYYFPGKQDVLEAALLHCAESAFLRQSVELEQIADAHDRLLRFIDLQLPVPGQVREEWLIWLQVVHESALNPALREVHNDFHVRWRDTVARVIELGRQQGVFRDVDPEQTAVSFMSLADGLAIRVLTATPGHSVETMRTHLIEFAEREIFNSVALHRS